MKNNIFIWGSKSKALIINKVLKNYKKELNIKFLNIKGLKKNRLKLKYIFDPYSKKTSFKTEALFSNNVKDFKRFIKDSDFFAVCIGSNYGKARYFISCELEKFHCKPLTIVNDFSFIDSSVILGKGAIVLPNSTVHCYSKIGDYCILNTSSTIEHECTIGHGTHVMSGACIAGKVKIGNFVTIGTNSTILPNLKISDEAYIGAGAVVTKDVRKNEIVAGNPARFVKYNSHKYDLNIFKQLLKIKKNN